MLRDPEMRRIWQRRVDTDRVPVDEGDLLSLEEFLALPTADRLRALPRLTCAALCALDLDRDEWKQFNLDDLRIVARAKHPGGYAGSKREVIDALVANGAVKRPDLPSVLRDTLFDSAFYKPTTGTDAKVSLDAGHANEPYLAPVLTSRLCGSTPLVSLGEQQQHFVRAPAGLASIHGRVGLLYNRANVALATSPDAILNFEHCQIDRSHLPDGDITWATVKQHCETCSACSVTKVSAVVEYKTATVLATAEQQRAALTVALGLTRPAAHAAAEVQSHARRTIFVDLAGEHDGEADADKQWQLFHTLVPKRDHRIQLLHHAAVTHSPYVLYVAAVPKDITYTAVVRFSERLLARYTSVLVRLYMQCGPFQDERPQLAAALTAYNTARRAAGAVPLVWQAIPDFCSAPHLAPSGGWRYGKDALTVSLHFGLMEAIVAYRLTHGTPFPSVTAIIPAIIDIYNALKAGVDNNFSAIECDNKPPIGGLPPGMLCAPSCEGAHCTRSLTSGASIVLQYIFAMLVNACSVWGIVRWLQGKGCETLGAVERLLSSMSFSQIRAATTRLSFRQFLMDVITEDSLAVLRRDSRKYRPVRLIIFTTCAIQADRGSRHHRREDRTPNWSAKRCASLMSSSNRSHGSLKWR